MFAKVEGNYLFWIIPWFITFKKLKEYIENIHDTKQDVDEVLEQT